MESTGDTMCNKTQVLTRALTIFRDIQISKDEDPADRVISAYKKLWPALNEDEG